MAEEQVGKSTVRFSEWKIERSPKGELSCVKYETVTIDGKEGEPVATRRRDVDKPDLRGADIEIISRFATRFNFNVADLAEQCHESDYQANARNLRNTLIELDKAEDRDGDR